MMNMRKLLVVSAGCAGLVLAITLVSCGTPWQTPDSEVLAAGTKIEHAGSAGGHRR